MRDEIRNFLNEQETLELDAYVQEPAFRVFQKLLDALIKQYEVAVVYHSDQQSDAQNNQVRGQAMAFVSISQLRQHCQEALELIRVEKEDENSQGGEEISQD